MDAPQEPGNALRLVIDGPLDGPENMARDEALMLRVGAGDSPPTLRLYQWDPPTISLGYFQPFEAIASLPEPEASLTVVRRLTGGGAILHDRELTYSLMLPAAHPLVKGHPNRLYELAHDAVIECFKTLGIAANRDGATDDSGAAKGPFFCFSRRHCFDVLIGCDKVTGSAQRRTKTALLQHGSIILASRYQQQATASLDVPYNDAVAALRQSFPDTFASLTGLTLRIDDWNA
ncbi:MAG: biotin/lipoate A/B protein ligase family protein, partial [Phycisphaerae bacterium]